MGAFLFNPYLNEFFLVKMCYYVTQKTNPKDLAKYYKAELLEGPASWEPLYMANGFEHPALSVLVKNERGVVVEFMQWGLLNNWGQPLPEAIRSSNNLLNARAETVFELPSFKDNILTRRCVIPINNFFEFKHIHKLKIPYMVGPADATLFNLAGIYALYQDPKTKEWHRSFAICTVPANNLMRTIHNTKFRQPVILRQEDIDTWLDASSLKEDLLPLLTACPDNNMKAIEVSRDIIKLRNKPAVLDPVEQPNEWEAQLELFK